MSVHVLGHFGDTVTIEIDQLPPSMNVIAGQGSRHRYTAAKKLWGCMLGEALRDSGLGTCTEVRAVGHLTFPDQRKRDQGNYRVLLEKALGDALQDVGVLEDDDWDSYRFGELTYSYEKGVRRTRVTLRWLPTAEQDAAA